MKKYCIWTLICLLAVPVFAASAAQPEAPAADITMNRSGRTVVFKHSTHTGAACVTCHHPVDGKEDYRSCATAGCHDVIGEGAKNKSPQSYYQAMHKGKPRHESCVSCHRKAASDAAVKERLPSGCKEKSCHPDA